MSRSGSLGSSARGCLRFVGLYMQGVAQPGIATPRRSLLRLDKKQSQLGVQQGKSPQDVNVQVGRSVLESDLPLFLLHMLNSC